MAARSQLQSALAVRRQRRLTPLLEIMAEIRLSVLTLSLMAAAVAAVSRMAILVVVVAEDRQVIPQQQRRRMRERRRR